MMTGVFERIDIRQFEPSDLEQAVRLNEEASKSTGIRSESGDWTADLADIDTGFIGSGGDFLVGEFKETIVVMGGYRRLSDHVAEIKRMRVAPYLQGRGIGRGFLGLLEMRIAEAGFTSIELSTTHVQVGAQRLYSGAGYTETKREEMEDGLVIVFYEKQLGSAANS